MMRNLKKIPGHHAVCVGGPLYKAAARIARGLFNRPSPPPAGFVFASFPERPGVLGVSCTDTHEVLVLELMPSGKILIGERLIDGPDAALLAQICIPHPQPRFN